MVERFQLGAGAPAAERDPFDAAANSDLRYEIFDVACGNLERRAPGAVWLGDQLRRHQKRSGGGPGAAVGLIDARACRRDGRLPATSRLRLDQRRRRRLLQRDLDCGPVFAAEGQFGRQPQCQLDKLAVFLLTDLPNFDPVERELSAKRSPDYQARIGDPRNQRVAIPPDIVKVGAGPFDHTICTWAEPANKRIDPRLEPVEIRIRRPSGWAENDGEKKSNRPQPAPPRQIPGMMFHVFPDQASTIIADEAEARHPVAAAHTRARGLV